MENMVATEENKTDMVPAVEKAPEAKKAKAKKLKAKVNMVLPGGSKLVKDEMCDVSAEDMAHLDLHFKDTLKHIAE